MWGEHKSQSEAASPGPCWPWGRRHRVTRDCPRVPGASTPTQGAKGMCNGSVVCWLLKAHKAVTNYLLTNQQPTRQIINHHRLAAPPPGALAVSRGSCKQF